MTTPDVPEAPAELFSPEQCAWLRETFGTGTSQPSAAAGGTATPAAEGSTSGAPRPPSTSTGELGTGHATG